MCRFEGCERDVHAKGLCQPHYRSERRRERGLKKPGPAPDPTRDRSRHNPQGTRGPSELAPEAKEQWVPQRKQATETHCANGHPWIKESSYWQEAKGYADGRRRICRLCARNWHTKYRGKEPIPDDVPVAIRSAKRTHCKRGHPYDEENTLIQSNGYRRCKICQDRLAFMQRLKRYDLSEEEYEALMSRSGGKCEICEGVGQDIDHEHATGKVRGILCSSCNNGLGRFRDNIDYLRAAVRYLEGQE